jgi:hypothetical protein
LVRIVVDAPFTVAMAVLTSALELLGVVAAGAGVFPLVGVLPAPVVLLPQAATTIITKMTIEKRALRFK